MSQPTDPNVGQQIASEKSYTIVNADVVNCSGVDGDEPPELSTR